MTDSDSIKTFQHVDGEVVYSFEYDKGKESLCIRIINGLTKDEYSDVFDNSTIIFTDHVVIKKPSILFNIFVDRFEKNDQRSKIESEMSNCLIIDKKYIIKIEINLDYISDTMEIRLPMIDKSDASQRVIERIDYRFDEYFPTIENKIKEMRESFENTTNELACLKTKLCEIEERNVTQSRQIDQLLKYNVELTEQNKTFNDTIQIHYDEFFQFATHSVALGTIQFDTEDLSIMGDEKFPSERVHCVIRNSPYSFPVSIIKYFRNLKSFTITNFEFCDLSFLAITPKLVKVSICHGSKMTSIEYLTKFPNIESIYIGGECKIKDLETLVNCPKLKTLSLSKNINTECFPEDVKFKITL